MITITLRIHGDLAELVHGRGAVTAADVDACVVPAPQVVRHLPAVTSIKDAVEAAGIPHCELGRVAGPAGESRNLAAAVDDGDVLDLHPAGPQLLPDGGLICDQHLGKLARLLRIMGCDIAYGRNWLEPEIARRAVNEHRALLSRGRAVLQRKAIKCGLLIRTDRVDDQAVEVVRRFALTSRVQLFGRCGLCNGRLRAVAKSAIAHRIPPRTARWLDAYFLCDACDQLYWEGTHVQELRRRVAAILARAQEAVLE